MSTLKCAGINLNVMTHRALYVSSLQMYVMYLYDYKFCGCLGIEKTTTLYHTQLLEGNTIYYPLAEIFF